MKTLGGVFLAALFFLSLNTWSANSPYEFPDQSKNAFSNPFPSLSREQRRQFFVGNSFFKLNWVQAPASTSARDGLGPTFNAVSCSACHQLDGRGTGNFQDGFVHFSILLRVNGAPQYGDQLNPFSVHGVPGEARPYVSFLNHPGQFPDGETYELREPLFRFEAWAFGEPDTYTRLSARIGNQLIGLGLLERIPREEIERRADPDDLNGDGISGRANYVLNVRTGSLDLGRFGWKAEQPTLEQQNAAAFLGDMGLTTSLFPKQNCPAPQTLCIDAHHGGEPEVEDQILERLTFYTQSIAVPTARTENDELAKRGREIFSRVGCANCHHPTYKINGVEIHPFTDLLLHDMGEDLADRSFGGEILATEWRTPPLWGVGLFQTVNGHTHLLHDGRARGVKEAVLWHGGEAKTAREAFKRLPREERDALVRFIESL